MQWEKLFQKEQGQEKMAALFVLIIQFKPKKKFPLSDLSSWFPTICSKESKQREQGV